MIKTNFLVLFIFFLEFSAFSQSKEPDMKAAMSWWPEQMNVWTPVAWKDHSYRFNVMYNGDILASPAARWGWPRENSKDWIGKDLMLKLSFNADGKPLPVPAQRTSSFKLDGGVGIQGWDEGHETPVLWTDYRLPQQGCVIRQEFFAHVKGDKAVQTALEPLYGWMRVKVSFTDPQHRADSIPVVVRLNRNYYDHDDHWEYAIAIDINPELKKYYQELHAEQVPDNGKTGMNVMEPDGKIRMKVLPGDRFNRLQFLKMEDGVYAVKFYLKNEIGASADILLPMLSESSLT